ncbi:Tripartite-type tricarboxylate transporter receptor subunit TctC OS=Castellaniella defragrans OX=75697 GN=HNR28_001854 PE=3 SV=1 [Castellaniella defragrans]
MKRIFAAISCMAALSCSTMAMAKPYPDGQIQIIVPFAPGGATDLIARQVADAMGPSLKQPVVVVNRSGASGAIGSRYVAQAAPDGYTLLLGVTTTHGINPAYDHRLGYDPVKDFTPISLVATMPHVLLVNPKSPAHTLEEFIGLAQKADPPFAFGSAGEGSPQHLAAVMMESEFGFKATHIPYKGGNPALIDLLGGRIQFMSTGLSEAMPFITSDRLRALAVASAERVPGLDVPTFKESGHPFQLTAWYALFGPAGLPSDVVDTLNAAVVQATRSSKVKNGFTTMNVTPVGSSPQELRTRASRAGSLGQGRQGCRDQAAVLKSRLRVQ